MPNEIERKRLKKKMLDRWENEGGRITSDPIMANESNPPSQRAGKNSRRNDSNDSSKTDSVSSSKKRRRALTQK